MKGKLLCTWLLKEGMLSKFSTTTLYNRSVQWLSSCMSFFHNEKPSRWLVDCGCVAIPIFKLCQKSMFAMACLTVGTLCHPSSGKSQLSKLNFIQELGT